MTYSIVAFDRATGARGVAVASKALCVGAHVPWGAPEVGALATQAWHDLRYGYEGLALLEEGLSGAAVVQRLTYGDADAPHRQLGIVDADYRTVSYTGSRCLPWAGGMCGETYAVQGNLLAGPQVVEAMAATYESLGDAPFAYRLTAALLAGDEAGGDRRGRQSAALRIWRGAAVEGDVGLVADLRVDDAELPVHGLAALLPRYWLEYGDALPDALPLAGDVEARVRRALGLSADVDAGAELSEWASTRNLERRVAGGVVDDAVLNVLEHGEDPLLARVAADPPLAGWPG